MADVSRALGLQLSELSRAVSAQLGEITKAVNSLTVLITGHFEARDRKMESIQEELAAIREVLFRIERGQ